MSAMRKEEYLELGMIQAREGKFREAADALRQAVAFYSGQEDTLDGLTSQDYEDLPPELFSYYGVCIALGYNRLEDGKTLCQVALRREVLRPDFYLNLGKVYLYEGKKARALRTFQEGLELFGKDMALLRELRRLGIRRKPVLGFLPRQHFINRALGRLFNRKPTLGAARG